MKTKTRSYVAFILCAIIAGGVLRFIPLLQKPLQIDEAWTLYFAKVYTFRQLLLTSPVPNDIHPGLYYSLVKLTLALTDNLPALRFASTFLPQVAGLVLFVVWGLKRKLNVAFLLIATATLSFSPFLTFYAWQLRMYGLVALWTSALGILLYEYVCIGKKEKFLFWMIPLFFLSQETHASGYLLTMSIVVTVVTLDYVSTKSLGKVLSRHKYWLGLTLSAFVVTLLPYYPFRFSNLFPRASWVPVPSWESAVRMFPLTALGLDLLINAQESAPAWTWQGRVLLAFLFTCLITYVYTMRRNKKALPLSLIMIFLVPVLALMFSYLAPSFHALPFFYKIIPPISIYLPRFFLSQAIFLHLFLAMAIYSMCASERYWQKSLALAVIGFLAGVWILTYRSINMVSTAERKLDFDKTAVLAHINPNRVLFYPGYTALYSINPNYHLPTREMVRLFDRSQAFEDTIKGDRASFSCTLTQGGVSQFTLIQDRGVPDFFQRFEANFSLFTQKNCIQRESNSYATLFSCRCREAL